MNYEKMSNEEMQKLALKIALDNCAEARKIIELQKITIVQQEAQIKMLMEMLDMEREISRLKNS